MRKEHREFISYTLKKSFAHSAPSPFITVKSTSPKISSWAYKIEITQFLDSELIFHNCLLICDNYFFKTTGRPNKIDTWFIKEVLGGFFFISCKYQPSIYVVN